MSQASGGAGAVRHTRGSWPCRVVFSPAGEHEREVKRGGDERQERRHVREPEESSEQAPRHCRAAQEARGSSTVLTLAFVIAIVAASVVRVRTTKMGAAAGGAIGSGVDATTRVATAARVVCGGGYNVGCRI